MTPLPTHWPAIALALVLGAASFCALGVAVASLIRNAEAVLNWISGALPVRPFNQALLGPFGQHTGFNWNNLAVLAAWGAAGAFIAILRFRWNPRPQ